MRGAYYNEHDPFAATWLRELIRAGHVPAGDVDERDIQKVQPHDLDGYTQAHFFAGIGGWPHALRLAGWPDDRPVWTGSCPCQPYSGAGKGKGDADPRNLWPEMFRLVRECRPVVCFGEQVESAIRHGWLDGISADLEGEGYAVGSVVLGAHSVSAPHIRQRLFWVADAGHDVFPRAGQGRRVEAPERREPGIDTEPGGVVRGLADAAGNNQQRLREWGASERSAELSARGHGATGGMADAQRAGVRLPGRGEDATAPGGVQDANGERQRLRADAGAVRDAEPFGLGDPERDGLRVGGRAATDFTRQSGHWSVFDLIPCRDGKARRVEPGLEPLAHGVSGRVAVRLPGQQAGPAVQEETLHWYSRVGALKGFGNAIVPQAAAEFIAAYLDARKGATA